MHETFWAVENDARTGRLRLHTKEPMSPIRVAVVNPARLDDTEVQGTMDMGRWPWCADARTLAVFRLGLGLSVVWDVADRARNLELYSDRGPIALATLLHAVPGAPALPVWGNLVFVGAFFAATAAAGVALALGVWTRSATLAVIVMMTLIQGRIPLVSFGGDSLLMALLWLSLLLPVHARWSFDSRWDRRALMVSSPAVLALTLQAIVLHAGSVMYKLESSSWRNGTALEPLLHGHVYASPWGEWFGLHAGGALAPLGYLSVVIETSSVLLLVPHRRLRLWVGVSLMGLQLGMVLMLETGLFQLFAIVALVVATPVSWPTPDSIDTMVERSRLRRTLATISVVVLPLTNTLNFFPSLSHVVSRHAPVLDHMGLNQSWRMFSDADRVLQGYFYVVAVMKDGVLVDLWTGERAPQGNRPSRPFSTYASFRERRLWEWLLFPASQPFVDGVGRWQCDRARRRLGHVVEVRAWFVDQSKDPYVATIFEHPCLDDPSRE
jgi:hypothetical protein